MEETVVHFMDLPEEQDWVVLLDCNVIGLAWRIKGDLCAISKALGEIEHEWRRGILHVVS